MRQIIGSARALRRRLRRAAARNRAYRLPDFGPCRCRANIVFEDSSDSIILRPEFPP
jgi:hypothetical protein